MSIISEIIVIAIILSATCITAVSVTNLKRASKKPANGELQQLQKLDKDIIQFHKMVKKMQKADMQAYHSKRAVKILT